MQPPITITSSGEIWHDGFLVGYVNKQALPTVLGEFFTQINAKPPAYWDDFQNLQPVTQGTSS